MLETYPWELRTHQQIIDIRADLTADISRPDVRRIAFEVEWNMFSKYLV